MRPKNWTDDIRATQTLVGVYKDTLVAYLEPSLYRPYLAPNGKIYVTASNGVHTLYTIHEPDKPGSACDFRNYDFNLPVHIGFCLPHYPNYRLYDWAGSPCDSLGVDAPDLTFRSLIAFQCTLCIQ